MYHILIVGNGYWANVVKKVLVANTMVIDAIFTSRVEASNNYEGSATDPSNYQILHYDYLAHFINSNCSCTLFLFICCGPKFHIDILERLQSINYSHPVYIWLEKPVCLNRQHYSFLSSYAKFNKNVHLFFNHQYNHFNLDKQILLNSQQAQSFSIELYTQSLRNRGIPIVLDFLPHFYSIINSIKCDITYLAGFRLVQAVKLGSQDTPWVSMSFINRDGQSSYFKCGHKASSNSISILYNTTPSDGSNAEFSSRTDELSVLYSSKPLDMNILLFLSGDYNSWPLECSSISFVNAVLEGSLSANRIAEHMFKS
jgi:hypothetical protein